MDGASNNDCSHKHNFSHVKVTYNPQVLLLKLTFTYQAMEPQKESHVILHKYLEWTKFHSILKTT